MTLSNRAASYFYLGKYEASLVDAEAVVGLKPEWLKGHYRRGAAAAALGMWADAVGAFEAALRIDPGNDEIRAKVKTVDIHPYHPATER